MTGPRKSLCNNNKCVKATLHSRMKELVCQTRIGIGALRIRCEAIGLILESEVTVIVDQYQCVKTDVSISEV